MAAAYLIDRTDRLLVWVISGLAATEFITEALVAQINGDAQASFAWVGASLLIFGGAALVQILKSRRVP